MALGATIYVFNIELADSDPAARISLWNCAWLGIRPRLKSIF